MCLFSGAWLRLLFCFFKFALSFFRFAIIRIWSTKVNFVIECIVRTWIFHCLVLIFCFQVTQIQHNINILQVTLTVSKKFVLLFYFTLIVDELTICHWNITDKEILYATKIFENIFFGCWFLSKIYSFIFTWKIKMWKKCGFWILNYIYDYVGEYLAICK